MKHPVLYMLRPIKHNKINVIDKYCVLCFALSVYFDAIS